MEGYRLTRRTFLKAAVATTAAAAVTGEAASVALADNRELERPDFEQFPFTEAPIQRPGDEASVYPPDKVVTSGCNFCPVACWFKVQVKDGRVTSIYGDPGNPIQAEMDPDNPGFGQDAALCVKGRVGQIQMMYNKYRITQPLKRIAPKGYDTSLSEAFEPISWEQAAREIGEKLVEIRDTYGGHTIVGKATDRVSRDGGPPLFRFLHLFDSNNPTHEGFICNDASGRAVEMLTGKGGQTNGYGWDRITQTYDLGDSKFILWFGANDGETHPVLHGWMRRRKEIAEATWVVIDPKMTPSGMTADLWLPIKPGTDMALAYGMLSHIIENDLIDHDFVENWIAGYDKLVEFLEEKGYTPEWAEPITGIPAKTIRKVAEAYATTKPAAIMTNAGINHHVNAIDTAKVIGFLVAITGNLGIPGGGMNYMHNSPVGLGLPPIQHGEPEFHDFGLQPQPDFFAEAILGEDPSIPYQIHALCTYQGNMLTQNSNTNRVLKALSREGLFYVNFGLFPDEDDYFADYKLPTVTFLEMDHVHRRLDRGIMWRDKVVDPIGEAREDMHVFATLTDAIADLDTKRPPEWWRDNLSLEWHANKKALWDAQPADSITADRMQAVKDVGPLEKRNILRVPCPGPDHPATQYLAENGEEYLAPDGGHPGTSVMFLDAPSWTLLFDGKRFPNESNKVEIWTEAEEERLAAYGHTCIPEFYMSPENMDGNPTLEYLDEWVPVNMGAGVNNMTRKVRLGVEPDPNLRKEYPVQLTTGRPSVVHFHQMTHWCWSLVQASGERYVQMHPKLAESIGAETGDLVKVETPRGSLTGPALIWDGIQENTIFIPHTFGPKQQVHADVGRGPWESVNVLTAAYYDNLSGQQDYKCQLCRVSKA
jgi:anaerobic selenocysteine-containing dehydrogenase